MGVLGFCSAVLVSWALLEKTQIAQLQEKEDGQKKHLGVVAGIF